MKSEKNTYLKDIHPNSKVFGTVILFFIGAAIYCCYQLSMEWYKCLIYAALAVIPFVIANGLLSVLISVGLLFNFRSKDEKGDLKKRNFWVYLNPVFIYFMIGKYLLKTITLIENCILHLNRKSSCLNSVDHMIFKAILGWGTQYEKIYQDSGTITHWERAGIFTYLLFPVLFPIIFSLKIIQLSILCLLSLSHELGGVFIFLLEKAYNSVVNILSETKK